MSEPPAGLKVLTDTDPLGEGGLGVAIPIDPGRHNVTASANGYKTWTTTIDVKEAESREIVIPALELERIAPEPVAIEAPPPAPMPKAPPETIAPTGLGTQRTAALVAGGVGVVGVVVGSIFGIQSIAKHDQAAPYCRDSVCTDSYWIGVQTEAHTAGTVSTAFFALGGVGLATAAVLWFTGKPSRAASTQLRLGVASIAVQRAW
jgi:PEGA domain